MNTVGAKVKPKLEEEIEEYREAHELNTSQAVRELLEEGLRAQKSKNSFSFSSFLIWMGTFLFAGQYMEISGGGGLVGVGLVAIGLAMAHPTFRRYWRRFEEQMNELQQLQQIEEQEKTAE